MKYLCSAGLLFLVGCTKDLPVAEANPHHFAKHWQLLDDSLFQELSVKLLLQNIDIKIAKERVIEARSLQKSAVGGLLPSVGLGVGGQQGNNRVGSTATSTVKQASLNTAWEINLFGGMQGAIKSAASGVWQSSMLLEAAKNSIIAQLATTVISWRSAIFTIRDLQALLLVQQKALQLLQSRLSAGFANAGDMQSLLAVIASNRSKRALAQAAAVEAQHQMEALLGIVPGSLQHVLSQHEHNSLRAPSAQSALAIKVKNIAKRPDVQAVKAQMLGAKADLMIAESKLWPDLTLGSFFGAYKSTHLPIAPNPVWALTASISMPLLDFFSIRAKVESSNSRVKQAELVYEKTVINALQETKTSLNDFLERLNACSQQEIASYHLQQVWLLAQKRFRGGYDDMLYALQAEEQFIQSRIDLVQQQAETIGALIAFYKASYVIAAEQD